MILCDKKKIELKLEAREVHKETKAQTVLQK